MLSNEEELASILLDANSTSEAYVYNTSDGIRTNLSPLRIRCREVAKLGLSDIKSQIIAGLKKICESSAVYGASIFLPY